MSFCARPYAASEEEAGAMLAAEAMLEDGLPGTQKRALGGRPDTAMTPEARKRPLMPSTPATGTSTSS
eukprot:3187726-Lingulodinium_polyedra.AAC.1